jgi:hypothetical protein
VAIAVIALSSVVLLVRAAADWDAAAQASRQLVVNACARDRHRTTYVVNLPDRLRGAYVGRNAFGAALLLECQWPDPTKIVGLTSQTVQRLDEDVQVARVGTSRWRVRLAEGSELVDLPQRDAAWRVQGVQVTPLGDDEFELVLSDDIALDDVVVVDRGRWVPLAEAG